MLRTSDEPQIGDEVSVLGHHGLFKITSVSPSTDNWRISPQHGLVDLELVGTGFRLENIPWTALYMEEIFAKRIINRLREEGRFPDSVIDFRVESGADHEENPALHVTFLVKPDASNAAIEKLTRFRGVAETSLRQEPLLNWWPYIHFSASGSALDVAS